ncbi:50S ribosomal protein L34e [Candidatus Woesearchaeota archaeon]|jgi:large subunit ribosomal protein L34e|nr:50S ribosomal protein L34e [Candidatus Woesearchaeota archaeon]MBT7062924.1 50S ribosomal protein L34e [Candidatus Woesearchaeota archaeon]MBT7402632.1 50S ribosomal protein L34e [Candidatus Woesearchaeota archaeon]
MLPKKQRRTPGNRTVTHTKPKKTGYHECALCHGILHGTPRGTVVQIRKMKKSERRPTRPFGGQLCSKCTRKVMSFRAQLKGEIIKPEDVPISLRGYVNGV